MTSTQIYLKMPSNPINQHENPQKLSRYFLLRLCFCVLLHYLFTLPTNISRIPLTQTITTRNHFWMREKEAKIILNQLENFHFSCSKVFMLGWSFFTVKSGTSFLWRVTSEWQKHTHEYLGSHPCCRCWHFNKRLWNLWLRKDVIKLWGCLRLFLSHLTM